MMNLAIELMERGYLPDALIRLGIRGLLSQRLKAVEKAGAAFQSEFIHALQQGPIAVHTDQANRQHYELPADFFRLVMGRHMKYSACLWGEGTVNLDEAEAAMLELTCRRAGLRDGQTILELGCGWGSLTLWMARHYPNARILAMSNSTTQRDHIEAEAARRGLTNVWVTTQDINVFAPTETFDRIVSVEMFEHMHNYRALFERLKRWLKADGKVFVHVFSHCGYAYPFETEGEDDWMGRHFFTGGVMPSRDLFAKVQSSLSPVDTWQISGRHYQLTCEAWLANQDRNRDAIMAIFGQTYGTDAKLWFQRWRVFFMACAELFGYRQGEEWGVSHYLFTA